MSIETLQHYFTTSDHFTSKPVGYGNLQLCAFNVHTFQFISKKRKWQSITKLWCHLYVQSQQLWDQMRSKLSCWMQSNSAAAVTYMHDAALYSMTHFC